MRKTTGITLVRLPAGTKHHRNAFTLVELLVVIGIIAVLAGIALPIIYKAYKGAQKSRTAADLGAIALALEAYKGDFGEYPQVEIPNTGFAILGKALASPFGDGYVLETSNRDPSDPPTFDSAKNYKPGDCVTSSNRARLFTADSTGGGSTYQMLDFPVNDGEDGPGFRNRASIGTTVRTKQGRVYPPYLQQGRVRMQGLALIDSADNPILYFSSSSSKGIVTSPNSYACLPVAGSKPRWDASQNLLFFRQRSETDDSVSLKAFAAMLGDFNPANESAVTNCDGKIDPGEGSAVDKPFLLWAPGADNVFGPNHAGVSAASYPTKTLLSGCDDITNFR